MNAAANQAMTARIASLRAAFSLVCFASACQVQSADLAPTPVRYTELAKRRAGNQFFPMSGAEGRSQGGTQAPIQEPTTRYELR